MLCNLMKSQLLIVMWPNPLGGIDCSSFECRINLRGSEVLNCDAESRHDFAANPGDPHSESCKIREASNRFTEPATHLSRCVPHRKADYTEVCIDRIDQIEPTSAGKP